jgi:hypothetical protein
MQALRLGHPPLWRQFFFSFRNEQKGPRSKIAMSDEGLLDHYLSPAMERYFARKLPDLDRGVRRQRIAECLKGLVLMQLSPGPILFSQAIDNIWHYWILETAEYAALCAALPGREFIHHSSDDYQPEENVAPQAPSAGVADRVVAFFAMYVGKFGLFDEGRLQYWPALAVLMEAQGWTLARTNAYLEQRAKALDAALSQVSLLHGLQP